MKLPSNILTFLKQSHIIPGGHNNFADPNNIGQKTLLAVSWWEPFDSPFEVPPLDVAHAENQVAPKSKLECRNKQDYFAGTIDRRHKYLP